MLTDNEIKKALECCGDEEEMHWCTECPYYDKENDFCQEDLHRDVLDLINRRDAEIERLEIELKAMRGAANSYKLECERLKFDLEYYQKSCDNLCKELEAEKIQNF